ncbi:MAG: hypothetical protein HGA23_08915, partial [Bacteroidales bacterium]|nr:hypothetical protein [Bacteroidales bacterium]
MTRLYFIVFSFNGYYSMHKYLSLFFTIILLWYSCEVNAQIKAITDQAYPELKPIPAAELDKLRSIPEIEIPAERGRYREMPA